MVTVISTTTTKFTLVFFALIPALEAYKDAIFATSAGRYPRGKYIKCY
jgi:hypothetical protein